MENRLTPLALLARRALAVVSQQNSLLAIRSFCSSFPSSSTSSSASPSSSHNKLFVAGLSWSVDEKTLLDSFSTFGEVSEVKILYDKFSGRSRGFGFVSFVKGDDANCAKEAMDGKALLGRPLRISFALEKVRGAPIVVPRLRSAAEANNRN